jgi:REP element-mobilizing transposase RayT
MQPQNVKQLAKAKRSWTKPLSVEAKVQGFKGWYVSKSLPHRDAPGTRQFITYRLADAMPASRRHEWVAFVKIEDDHEKQRRIESYLDHGYGECHLRDPRIATLVQENLWQHDGVKYRLLAWVIMPNHLHVLVEIWQVPMGEILKSWKSYTAKAANKILGRTGTFWAEDYFDRYLRDDEHYRRTVRYIENNPSKARLVKSPSDWLWTSARYRGAVGPVVPTLTHPTANRSPGQDEGNAGA